MRESASIICDNVGRAAHSSSPDPSAMPHFQEGKRETNPRIYIRRNKQSMRNRKWEHRAKSSRVSLRPCECLQQLILVGRTTSLQAKYPRGDMRFISMKAQLHFECLEGKKLSSSSYFPPEIAMGRMRSFLPSSGVLTSCGANFGRNCFLLL